MSYGPLTTWLLTRLPREDEPTERLDELEARLQDIVQRARSKFPAITIETKTYLEHLGRHVNTADLPQALVHLHTEDLFLSCACLGGDTQALSILTKSYYPDVRHALARVDPDKDFTDEVLQGLSKKLLMASEPKLATYSGFGPLASWLSIVALRLALNLKQAHNKQLPLEDRQLDLEARDLTPEQQLLKNRSGAEIKSALREAVAQQTSQMRAVLRLYYADGASLEHIAAVYHVHASTISRWLERARKQIFSTMTRTLRQRHGLTRSEIDSMIAMGPALELSLSWLLQSSPPGEGG